MEKMREVDVHPNISLLTNSEVTEVHGEEGDYRVRVAQRPRFIDPHTCIACGACAEVCPVEPKAIHMPHPNPVPRAFVIDEDRCIRFQGQGCTICRDVCPTGAIDFDQDTREINISVGAIIAASGFDVFDARGKGLLGYGNYSNVITGLEMEERLWREDTILLPSRGTPPQDVAFIQCVGSRDEHIGNGYCSGVCCKYAIRLARVLHYQNPGIRITIFYMDLQTGGKDFGDFYEQGKEEIRFIQGIPVRISEASSDELLLKYEDLARGKVVEERHELVVLSVGIIPRRDAKTLASTLGINLGKFGFFQARDGRNTTASNREGIFIAGCCQGPKDIPQSMTHGALAATRAGRILT
jgi:heterodisulfide reductase subunit A